MGPGKAKQISLGDDFGEVAVKVNGVRVDVHADGSIQAYTNGPVKVHPAANENSTRAKPKIGDKLPDGTVCAGISPDTHKPMYTTPADAPTHTFNEAGDYAAKLEACGHHDWHVPTKGELNLLWENRDEGALKGTFNVTGSFPAGSYWSASELNAHDAWIQYFSNGHQTLSNKYQFNSLRCVRG